VGVAIILRTLVSDPSLGVVMDEVGDILVKLEVFGRSVEGQGKVRRDKEER